MDQMMPSPGFSIPSIGTPYQQLEEDQTIIANNPYYAQNSMMTSHPPTGLTPAGMGNNISVPQNNRWADIPNMQTVKNDYARTHIKIQFRHQYCMQDGSKTVL